MSSKRSRGKGSLEIVGEVARRIRRDGVDVSDRDATLLAEVLVSRRYLLLDLTDDPHCAQGFWRALNSLPIIDAKAYAEDVKWLRAKILALIPDYRLGALGDFVDWVKANPGVVHYMWIVTPLASIERSWRADEAIVLRFALQWASYDTKLNMRDVDFSAELSAEYLDDEFAMKRFVYDESLLQELNNIVCEWFEVGRMIPELEPHHIRHGNGATSEVPRSKASSVRKCFHFAVDEKASEYAAYRGSYDGFRDELFFKPQYQADLGPITLDFVPKSPLTNRVISKEHVTRMWQQNDVAKMMDIVFQEKRLNIHLHDQSASRRMALEGSIDGRYDTFDYSKASDFVTNTVVRGITCGTWLFNALQLTRTEYVEVKDPPRGSWEPIDHYRRKVSPRGRSIIVPLEKFAPMGSSTCFPTESLVFATLAELAVRRKLQRRSHRGDYLVYGDDVVIRSDCSDELRLLSSLMHFKVNDDKTCREVGRHIFREACGIEAIDGLDVTPLRVSRRFVGCANAVGSTTTTPGEYVGIIDGINRCYQYGFVNLRKFFNELLSKWDKFGEVLRVDHSDYVFQRRLELEGYQSWLANPCFIVPDGTATNYRSRIRFDCNPKPQKDHTILQRTEAKVWTVSSKNEKIRDIPANEQEEARLYLWLLQGQTDPSPISSWSEDWLAENFSKEELLYRIRSESRDGGTPCSAETRFDVEHSTTTGVPKLVWRKTWQKTF